MRTAKIMVVLGTRPEAIKLAPVILELQNRQEFELIVCNTAQHLEMVDSVLSFFDIKPHYTLKVFEAGQSLASLNAKLLVGLDEILMHQKPDYVIVQGDTSTTYAGAFASYLRKIPVLHVEAGLRTFNKYAPFPEELNRVFVTKIADFHFPPTFEAKRNLLAEGVHVNQLKVTGNTGIDALHIALESITNSAPETISQLGLHDLNDFVLMTVHRRENIGEHLDKICDAIDKVVNDFKVPIVIPVHPNPAVSSVVEAKLGHHKNVTLVQPLPYQDFIWLLNKSKFVVTDSGGLQEEAPAIKKPVVLLRDVTERAEGVFSGNVIVAGHDADLIYDSCKRLLTDSEYYEKKAVECNQYGDGKAASRILETLLHLVAQGNSEN